MNSSLQSKSNLNISIIKSKSSNQSSTSENEIVNNLNTTNEVINNLNLSNYFNKLSTGSTRSRPNHAGSAKIELKNNESVEFLHQRLETLSFKRYNQSSNRNCSKNSQSPSNSTNHIKEDQSSIYNDDKMTFNNQFECNLIQSNKKSNNRSNNKSNNRSNNKSNNKLQQDNLKNQLQIENISNEKPNSNRCSEDNSIMIYQNNDEILKLDTLRESNSDKIKIKNKQNQNFLNFKEETIKRNLNLELKNLNSNSEFQNYDSDHNYDQNKSINQNNNIEYNYQKNQNQDVYLDQNGQKFYHSFKKSILDNTSTNSETKSINYTQTNKISTNSHPFDKSITENNSQINNSCQDMANTKSTIEFTPNNSLNKGKRQSLYKNFTDIKKNNFSSSKNKQFESEDSFIDKNKYNWDQNRSDSLLKLHSNGQQSKFKNNQKIYKNNQQVKSESQQISPKISKSTFKEEHQINSNSKCYNNDYHNDYYKNIESNLLYLMNNHLKMKSNKKDESLGIKLIQDSLQKLKLLKRDQKSNINFLNSKYKEFKNERYRLENKINDLINQIEFECTPNSKKEIVEKEQLKLKEKYRDLKDKLINNYPVDKKFFTKYFDNEKHEKKQFNQNYQNNLFDIQKEDELKELRAKSIIDNKEIVFLRNQLINMTKNSRQI